MLKESFKITDVNIIYKLRDIEAECFIQEGNFYIFSRCYTDKKIKIDYKIILNVNWLNKQKSITTKNNVFSLSCANQERYNLMFMAKRSTSSTDKKGNKFLYRSGEHEFYRYTFKISEVVNSAFESNSDKVKEPVKMKHKNSRKMTSKQKRQKWLIEHPLQGGAWSPR